MIVRPARQEDIPAIVEIVERCGLGVDGLDYSKWTGVVLVAVRQNEIIGFVSALAGAPYAVITEIGVLPEHQKSRACAKLLESMELILRSLGVPAWAGYVGSKREDVQDMIDRWGGRREGDGRMYVRNLA